MTECADLFRAYPPDSFAAEDRRVQKAREHHLPGFLVNLLAIFVLRQIRKQYRDQDAWYHKVSEERRKRARDVVAVLRAHNREVPSLRTSWKQRLRAVFSLAPFQAILVCEVLDLIDAMKERVLEEERKGNAIAAIFSADPDHESRVLKSKEQIAGGDYVTFTPEQLRNRTW